MTDILTRQNPLLKSIAAFFVIFGVSPVLVIAIGLVFFNSNFSMHHFNVYYLNQSFSKQSPIYIIKKMKSRGMTIISKEKTKEDNRIIHSLLVESMLISAGIFMSIKNNIIIRF